MTLNGQIPCHVSEWKIKRGIIVPDLHVEHYSTQQIKATKMKWDGRNKWCNYFPISNQQRRLHFAQTCQIKHRAPFSIVHRFSCQETSSSNLATKSIMNNHGHKLTPLAFPSESKKDHDISNQTEPNRTKPKAKRTNEMERYESQCVEWLIDRSWVSTTQLFQRPLGARCGASVRGPAVSKAARNLQTAPVNRSALFTCKRPTRPVQCTRSQCNCTRSSRRFLPAEGFFFCIFWGFFLLLLFFFGDIIIIIQWGDTVNANQSSAGQYLINWRVAEPWITLQPPSDSDGTTLWMTNICAAFQTPNGPGEINLSRQRCQRHGTANAREIWSRPYGRD